MPLTPAHAAAVVPLSLWKPFFWLSPLVVGSMAPDYIYFVFPPRSVAALRPYTLGTGAVLHPRGAGGVVCLSSLLQTAAGAAPAAAASREALAVLRTVSATAAATPGLDRCAHFPGGGDARRLGRLYARRRMGPARLPANCRRSMITVAGHELHWCGLLQYGSSLLGLGLLAWWSWQWYRRAPAGCTPADSAFLRRARPRSPRPWSSSGPGTGSYCGLAYACKLPGPFDVREFLRAAFITGIDAFGAGASLRWLFRRTRRERSSSTLLEPAAVGEAAGAKARYPPPLRPICGPSARRSDNSLGPRSIMEHSAHYPEFSLEVA